MKNLWKYIVGLVVVLLLVGYIWFSEGNSSNSTPAVNPPVVETTTPGTDATGSASSTNPPAIPTPTSTPAQPSSALYKDGSYTGSAADAFYGTVQVKAIVSGGKITDVQFLQSPDAPGHTSEVSATALPQLKQEAIAAQSANVNIVSGATQDSQAFQQSLAAALAEAKN